MGSEVVLNAFQQWEITSKSFKQSCDIKQEVTAIAKEEIPSAVRMRKSDLIRYAIEQLSQSSDTFTFFDIYTYIDQAIDKQTVSALTNRLYTSGELQSIGKTKDGCVIYCLGMLKAAPEWVRRMSREQSLSYFITNDRHRATDEPLAPQFTICNHLHMLLCCGFDNGTSSKQS